MGEAQPLTAVITFFFVTLQIAVPRHSVGVVIGRSGEMIKKIQSDAGVKIQFKPGECAKYFLEDSAASFFFFPFFFSFTILLAGKGLLLSMRFIFLYLTYCTSRSSSF